MLFWILAGLVVLLTIGAVVITVSESWNDGFDGFLAGIGTLLVSSVIFGLIWLACCWLIPKESVATDSTHQLKALGNSSALEGRSYFLGGGYVKDKRVLNFITRDDSGAIKVQQANASDSTIYEGATSATVKVLEIDGVNGWVSPWPLTHSHAYEFNIPSGSVVESYSLDNK